MCRKQKLVRTFPRTELIGLPIFSLKGQRPRSSDVKKSPENYAYLAYMFTFGCGSRARRPLCHAVIIVSIIM